MQQDTQLSKKASIFWGVVCVIIGIFLLLVSADVIRSADNSFSAGRLPVFLFALDFIIIGIIMIFAPGKKEPATFKGKIMAISFFIFFLIPFHMVEYTWRSIGFGFILGFIDLAILYVFVSIIFQVINLRLKK